jgi:hypothetical protein
MNVASNSNSVVSARGLRKAYKDKVALDGTSFQIPAGLPGGWGDGGTGAAPSEAHPPRPALGPMSSVGVASA